MLLFNNFTQDLQDGITNPAIKPVLWLRTSSLGFIWDENLKVSNGPDQGKKLFEINRMYYNTECIVDLGRKKKYTNTKCAIIGK